MPDALPKQFTRLNLAKAERWMRVLPKDLAVQQANWELRREVRRMRQLGFTVDKIAKRMGVLPGRISQLSVPYDGRAPIEKYLNEQFVCP